MNWKKFGMYLSGFGIASVVLIPGREGEAQAKTLALIIAVGMIVIGGLIQIYYWKYPQKPKKKKSNKLNIEYVRN